MANVDWRRQFEDLQNRRPDLAERVCRRLLVEMQRQGVVDFEELDHEIAVALRLVGSRSDFDPNRPKPQLPTDSHIALYDLALKHAEKHLSPEEISATILLVEKRQLAHEVSRIAEDLGRRIVQNMAMLGFVAARADLVSAEAMRCPFGKGA